ncbi:MAG: NAD-dependent epimerase/dehydratase family protein, partial [Clostridiales bacterium]
CKFVNMKLFHMYGPNDSSHKFIPQMINAINNNIESIKLTQGDQERDFIYIEDVIRAYSLVLKNIDKLSGFTEFQVGTGEVVSIRDLLSLIKHITNSNTKLLFGALPYRNGEIMSSKANTNELLRIGWKAIVSLEDGLSKILKD